MDSINFSKADKAVIQEKPMIDVRFIEKVSTNNFLDNTTTAGFDGLSETDCKALEKRRMYLNLAEPSFS
jgi:hypothetical protein